MNPRKAPKRLRELSEREALEELLCLDAHQLEPRAWVHTRGHHGYAYWYKGPPTHSERKHPTYVRAKVATDDREYEYRTAIVIETYGKVMTPAGWERVARYKCPSCNDHPDIEQSAGYPAGNDPYLDDPNRLVIIDEGYYEVVYRREVTQQAADPSEAAGASGAAGADARGSVVGCVSPADTPEASSGDE